MNIRSKLLIICITMSLLCSCRAHEYKKQIPEVTIPSTEINKTIHLEANLASPGIEQVKNLQSLLIQNQSDEIIVLKDRFINIYYWQNGDWILIQNRVSYPNYDYLLLPEGESVDRLYFDVLPSKSGIIEPTTATIVVIGYTKSSNEQVVGTVEVTVSP